MSNATALSYEVLLTIALHLGEEDLLSLAATKQELYVPVLRRAIRRAVIGVRYNDDIRPVIHAIKSGNIKLLTQALQGLDSAFPTGWRWREFFQDGAGRLLYLAATHSVVSLEHLVQLYPLSPSLNGEKLPAAVSDHGFYSTHAAHHVYMLERSTPENALVDYRNEDLVSSALMAGRLDCAYFLLNYEPQLFPRGFPVRGSLVLYLPKRGLQFLLCHSTNVDSELMYHAATLTDLPSTEIFQDLRQTVSYNIDQPSSVSYDPYIPDATRTALHMATRNFASGNVEALLSLGANPNGLKGDFWIKEIPSVIGSYYLSSNPLLALLFTQQWNEIDSDEYVSFSSHFIQCFRSLLRYGATTLLPIPYSEILDILLYRIWWVLCKPLKSRIVVGTSNASPKAVKVLLATLDDKHTPLEELYHVVAEADPLSQSGSERPGLRDLFAAYQAKYGDLPGPSQLIESAYFSLPTRYGQYEYQQLQ